MRYRLKSGAALAYRPSGAGEMTLVMLHPVGLRGAVWSGVARELSNDHRVIAVDLPGHGDSDVPSPPHSIHDMAEAVLDLVEAVGGDQVVPIGCSMGSAVAAAVAAKGGAKIAAMVLSSASHGYQPERHKALTGRAESARGGMPRVLETTMQRWFTAETLATRTDLTAPVVEWLLDGDPIVHARCWEALRDFDYGTCIPNLTVPALVIAATLDQSAGPSAVKALASALPDAEYAEIEGAGHLSPWERPRDYAELVRAFLSRRLNRRQPSQHKP
jgi:3-oxoadipate enol-lactonase